MKNNIYLMKELGKWLKYSYAQVLGWGNKESKKTHPEILDKIKIGCIPEDPTGSCEQIARRRNTNYQQTLVFAMYLLSTIMAVFYIIQNGLPLSWDQSSYMQVSAEIGHAILRFDWLNALKIFVWHDAWSNRPALHMLVGGIYASITQFDVKLIVILSNMTWVALIFFLIYKLSEHLHKNSGVLSVFLFFSSFGLVFLYRDFLSELALTAGVILVQYAYIMSDNLESRRWSIFTALCMILGALTKESFILYTLPLFIYSVFNFLYNKKYKKPAYCLNWLMVFILSSCIIAGFYLPIIHELVRNMFDNVGNTVGQYYSRFYTKDSLHYYLVYVYYLSDIMLYPVLFIALGSASFYFLTGQLKKLDFQGVGFLLALCIVFPVVILTVFVTDTDVRFIFPILPLVLIFCSIMIQRFSTIIKWFVIAIIFIASVINLITSFIPIKWLPYMIHTGEFTLYRQHFDESGTRGIDKIHLDVTGVIQDIFAFFRTNHIKEKRIGILTSLAYLNINIMNSYAALYEEHQNFIRIMSPPELANVDYVITTDKLFTVAPWETSSPLQSTFDAIMTGLQTGKYTQNYTKNISIDDNRIYLIDLKKS